MNAGSAQGANFRGSALYRRHLALGAALVDYHGWRTAARFTSAEQEAQGVQKAVGLADVSWLGKLDVRGTLTEHVLAGLAAAPAPPVAEAPLTPPRAWRLAHQHALVTCGPDEREMRQVQASLAPDNPAGNDPASCVHVTDVTSVYAALLLAGPQSREVLHRLTDTDVSETAMPNLKAAQGGLAHVAAILLRADVGGAPAVPHVPAFWLLVGREYGEYVWEAIMHAGRQFGMVPFGVTALAALADRPFAPLKG